MRLVVTSVRYADFLAVTLPAWKAIVPSGALYVATSIDDIHTQQVAVAHGVPCLCTEAWTQKDPTCHEGGEPTFNLALGLDTALGLVPGLMPEPTPGEIIGHASADCVPSI